MTVTVKTGFVAVALTTALAGAGIATTAAGAAPAKTTGKVAFVAGGSDEAHTVAVIHGAITGAGKDVSHDQYDVAKLPKGTFHLNHPDKQAKFSYKIDPKTCYGTFHEVGTWTISNGTGAYKGYTGKGTYTGDGTFILDRNKKGACDQNSEGTGLFVVRGSGTVTH